MSYGGAALKLVGGAIQTAAAARANAEMEREYKREMARQGQYAAAAQQVFYPRIGASSAEQAGQDLATNTANREAQYGKVGQTQLGSNPESSAYQARDQAALDLAGRQRAALGSYGDWQHNLGVGNQAAQRGLNTASNFAGTWAQSVFPYEMWGAQHSQDNMAFWGSVVGSLGGIMGDMQYPNQTAPMMGASQNGVDYTPQQSIDPNTGFAAANMMIG